MKCFAGGCNMPDELHEGYCDPDWEPDLETVISQKDALITRLTDALERQHPDSQLRELIKGARAALEAE